MFELIRKITFHNHHITKKKKHDLYSSISSIQDPILKPRGTMESYKCFSKIALYVRIFEEKNRSFSPVSSKQLRRSGSKFFFEVLRRNRGACFFPSRCGLDQILQSLGNSYHRKNTVFDFDGVLSILLLLKYFKKISWKS
jgi:hypothetical protein